MTFDIKKICFLISLLLFSVTISAQLSTPFVLSSNMVLQQGQIVPVWGKASSREKIQVVFGKQRLKTRADAEGNWKVELQAMKADKTPQKMTIKGTHTQIVYDNILVGEVWLCSGQSNMEYTMKRHPTFLPPVRGEDIQSLELQKPANEMIRVYNTQRDGKPSSWKVTDGKSLEKTSVVGYYFIKAIQEKLDVPVGIITSAVGGTLIEAWTTSEAYHNSSVFATDMKRNGKVGGTRPGNWYKSMIAPLVPFVVKGFLWYQGENNCGKRDRQYAEKYEVLVDSWRKTFNTPDAPFYYVVLAPHIYSDRKHNKKTTAVTADELPIFREQQIKSASLVPNSDFIIITDLVDALTDIHPPYKWEVGARLARLALAKNYGFSDIVFSGPRISRTTASTDSLIVTFNYCADGLKTNDEKRLNWFEVAGKDGIFRPAFADIKGKNEVVVYHPEIKNPAKVRFGWHETAVPNLVNSEGLPATPFHTIVE